MKRLLVLVVSAIIFGGDICDSLPQFHFPADYFSKDESFPNGSVLFNFTVTSSSQETITDVIPSSYDTEQLVRLDLTRSGARDMLVSVVTINLFDYDGHGNVGHPGRSSVVLRFMATDTNSEQVFKDVSVYITDINDNAPILKNIPYTWEIPETSVPGTSYTHISAVDYDQLDDGRLRYSITPNTQSIATGEDYMNTFGIGEITGLLALKNVKLDYETNSFYQFTVVVKDNRGQNVYHNDTAELIIKILDVQDTPPYFIGIPYRKTIIEERPINSHVLTVNAIDGDRGVPNTVNYTIQEGPCSDLFNISEDGDIRTSTRIDRDTGDLTSGVCILTIVAQEQDLHPEDQHGNTTASSNVTIYIDDINDNSPTFNVNATYDHYVATIQENTPRSVPITLSGAISEIIVTDTDEGNNARMTLTLLYPDGSPCTDFYVTPPVIEKSGSTLIRVNNSAILDYEERNNITFIIQASDTGNHIVNVTVVLHIEDMNDNNPEFENISYEFSIPENSVTGTEVGIVKADDRDSGNFGEIVYALYGGDGRFHIDNKTGNITTQCEDCDMSLDREKNSIYFMTLTATDLNGRVGGRSNSTSLVIHLTDVNDNTPTFLSNQYTVTVGENNASYNTTNGTALIQVQASDNDEENTNNTLIEYRIDYIVDDVIPSNNFTINTTTGELYLVTQLDYEKLVNTSGRIHVVIQAVDMGEPPLTGSTTVAVRVQDMNDEDPVFETETSYMTSIEENATSVIGKLTNVIQLNATDADGTAPNNRIQYFITDGAWSDFSVNSTTGDVSVQINRHLDRDVRPSYNITIIAIDMGSPPLTGTVTLYVDIIDVNDKSPVFDPRVYTASVRENQTEYEDIIIVSLNATDTDLSSVLEYTITDVEAWDENGNVANKSQVENYFGIFPTNGSLYITETPDREVAKTITVTVMVRDVNAFYPPNQNDTATVRITIIDINDNFPEFEPSHYDVNVSENANNPTILVTVRATDRDENRTIRYGIQSVEHDVTAFKIDPNTGVLSKSGLLDREEHETIVVNVSATDNGHPNLTAITTVFVTVLDFNDNAPQFINLTSVLYVPENATVNETILYVYAEDIDQGPNAEVRYEIESGDFGKFRIDPINGNISVSNELDREQLSVYTLRVKASDSPENVKDRKETLAIITVHIDDVNDNSPEFTSKQYAVDVLEDVDIGTSIATVSAIDKDQPDTVNSEISYIFGNNTEELFSLNELTGVISVNTSLVGKVMSHIIELIATDHGNPTLQNNITSVVNITVVDKNLNRPVIDNLPIDNTIKVYECVNVGFNVYLFNYSDLDHGINAEAYFNISDIESEATVLDAFEISLEGQLTTKKKLDATVRHEYKFHIEVTDKGTPTLSSDKTTITVIIIDVDDNLPSFIVNKTTMTVKENQPVGTVVGSVTAIDADLDSISCYSIIESDAKEHFDIGRNNGSIVTKMELDYEETNQYTFNVEVKDCSIVANISECDNVTRVDADIIDVIKVTVNVSDMNDNPPYFLKDEIIVGMRRVTEVGVPIDLSLKTNDIVGDEDTVNNGRLVWVFNNSAPITLSNSLKDKLNMEGVNECEDKMKHLVCVTGNGSVINNKYYSEDMSGYLIVPVGVKDEAGGDTANIKIFLISDSQILVMTVLGRKEEIAEKKTEIMSLYSTITGYTFVYDWVEDHKTAAGTVETYKTDLYFHVVDPKTQEILSTIEAIRVVDQHYNDLLTAVEMYKVVSIKPSVSEQKQEDDPMMTVYILSAVIAVLVMTVIIIVYVSMTTRMKYRTKLKAATVKPQDITQKVSISEAVVPGSNVYSKLSNPLLDAELPPDHAAEYDNLSMGSQNSLDKNDVGSPRKDGPGSGLEEREVTLDMYTEDTDTTGPMESPLDEALRLHEQTKTKRPTDTENGLAFQNYAFEEEFESTEI